MKRLILLLCGFAIVAVCMTAGPAVAGVKKEVKTELIQLDQSAAQSFAIKENTLFAIATEVVSLDPTWVWSPVYPVALVVTEPVNPFIVPARPPPRPRELHR